MLFRRIIISPTCINFPTAATKRDQSNNCCNQACCFLGLYNGLTGFAYGLIWHGVAWWIMLAVTASRPGKYCASCITTRFLVHTCMCTCPDPPSSFKTGHFSFYCSIICSWSSEINCVVILC